MPLSEHEQRILDEIERRLAAEDPKFARQTSAATPRGVAIKRARRGIVGFVIGMGLLIGGLSASPDLLVPFGLAAFAVMLTSLTVVARAAKDLARHGARKRTTLWDRVEDRFKKRLNRDDDAS